MNSLWVKTLGLVLAAIGSFYWGGSLNQDQGPVSRNISQESPAVAASASPLPSPIPSSTVSPIPSTSSLAGVKDTVIGALRGTGKLGPKEQETWAKVGLDISGERALINIKCAVAGGDCRINEMFKQALEDNVRTISKQMYGGMQPSLTLNPAPDSLTQVPICDREGGLFGGEEQASNHLGQRCGSACQFFQGRVCLACGSPHCNYRPSGDGKFMALPATCGLERAWKRGALMHQVKLAFEEVVTEMEQQQVLFVGDKCGTTIRDTEFGNLSILNNALIDQYLKLDQGRLIGCDISPDSPFDHEEDYKKVFENDRRIPAQAACYLNAVSLELHAATAHLGVCEVFARAEEKFFNEINPKLEKIVPQTAENAMKDCRRRNRDHKVTTECLNQEYAAQIGPAFQRALSGGESRATYVPGQDVEAITPALRSCPKSAKDCKCSDILFCGSGTPFMRAELASIVPAVAEYDAVKKNLKYAADLLSHAPYYDARGNWIREQIQSACNIDVPSPGTFSIRDDNSAPAPAPSPVPSVLVFPQDLR